jgi:hypothetical protein
MANTLEVYHNGVLVFSSKGRWLHPLFELETFLASGDLRPEELEIRDKVIGRAAAAMMVRLRLGRVHAGLLSRLGEDMLVRHGIPYGYDELVPRITCRTEDLSRDMQDPQVIYDLVRSLVSS